jgi:hypothetical protein
MVAAYKNKKIKRDWHGRFDKGTGRIVGSGNFRGRVTSVAKTVDEILKASETQVGGNHYKGFVIQPVEFIHKNKLGYIEGCVVKYICRWRDKNGIEDLDKVIHYIQLLKEYEQK